MKPFGGDDENTQNGAAYTPENDFAQDDFAPEAGLSYDDAADTHNVIEDTLPQSAPLAASRVAAAAAKKSGRTGLLAGVAGVIALGLGGGYYYLNTLAGADDWTPPARTQAEAITEKPQNLTQDLPQDPATDLPLPENALPALPDFPDDFAIDDATGDVTQDVAQGADFNTADTNAGDAPPADLDLVPATPVDPIGAPATALSGTATATVKMADDVPLPDLPLPAGMDTPDDTDNLFETASLPDAAEVLSAPDIQPPTAPENIAQDSNFKLAQDIANEAEAALATHAAQLEQMDDHTTAIDFATIDDTDSITAREAIVRPLPNRYLVVNKNASATDVDARMATARAALANRQTRAALNLFDELALDYPQDTRILMGRAVALQQLGLQTDALAAYEKVLVAEPKNLEALTNMLGLIRSQDPALALAKLKELRAAYPARADITAQLGIAYGATGDFANALRYLDIADALDGGNPHIAYNKAIVYDRMGQTAQATALYRHILQLAADNKLAQPLPLDTIRNRLSVLR